VDQEVAAGLGLVDPLWGALGGSVVPLDKIAESSQVSLNSKIVLTQLHQDRCL